MRMRMRRSTKQWLLLGGAANTNFLVPRLSGGIFFGR